MFLPCFTLYLSAISEYKPPGGLYIYLDGQFNGGFLRYEFGGLIHGGAYFRNFTVYTLLKSLLNYLQIT